jgi:hypothetical protein
MLCTNHLFVETADDSGVFQAEVVSAGGGDGDDDDGEPVTAWAAKNRRLVVEGAPFGKGVFQDYREKRNRL